MTDEITAAIKAANLHVRHEGEEGPRVAVLSQSLGGSFFFGEAEALKRIRRAYPEASEERVLRGLRHLRDRVRVALAPPPEETRRGNWVHGWME